MTVLILNVDTALEEPALEMKKKKKRGGAKHWHACANHLITGIEWLSSGISELLRLDLPTVTERNLQL